MQNSEQHLLENSLPSSYTRITHPPASQTCINMQNSGFASLSSSNTPLPSSVEVSACERSYNMTNPCPLAIPEGNRLRALRTIFVSVTADPKDGWTELNGKKVKFEENGERRRIANCLTDTCILTYTTEYINLRDKLLSRIKQISKKIGKVVVRTRKLTRKLVDSKVWISLIDYLPVSIMEAAYIMQAAQVCYNEATRKEKPRFAQKENIESKISKLVLSKDLLEKNRKQEKLSTSDTKSLRKILRECNLNLSSVTDLSKAEIKRMSRFYGELTERVESEHMVIRNERVSFWSIMRNKNDDTVTYNDYLIP
ncbi:hypothetical protein CWI38_2395p0010, partial [Hamiltosporidium tvaerminnensis]